MRCFLPTLIVRHRKENVKKCSLRGLETRDDFHFMRYPTPSWPNFAGYCLLTLNAPPLSELDAHLGLFLIDGTWRYAEKMVESLPKNSPLVYRSIPGNIKTAYPRYQTGCIDPEKGLASIEALYVAFFLTGRKTDDLLDHYYFGKQFMEKNNYFIDLRKG